MKKFYFTCLILLFTACTNKPEYSEQEENQIKQEAYTIIRNHENLIDSLEVVKNSIRVETKYDLIYQAKTLGIIKGIQEHRDSLYMAINKVEPNYEAIKEQIDIGRHTRNSAKKLLTTAKAEADNARESE